MAKSLGKAWLIDTRTENAYELVEDDTIIGRERDCHIYVANDLSVSRHHAMIRFQNGVFVVKPLRNRIQILLNNEYPVDAPEPLEHGDELTIGATIFRFVES